MSQQRWQPTEKAWEGIFWRGAKVKISTFIGDGTNLNKKLWAKQKHLKASKKGSSPNKSDSFPLKMP